MSIYTRQLLADGFATGLVGTIGYVVTSVDGTVRIARTTAGITEIGGGTYAASAAFDTAWGFGRIVWDDAAGVYAVETFNATDEGAGPLIGSGADRCTQTITNSDTGQPVADADVWITTDAIGANVFAGTLQTNSQGKVTFLLDDGSPYYLWMQKDGVNPILGELFTAEADA